MDKTRKVNVNSFWFKAAILSISLLVQAAPAVAGTIPLMRKTFSSQSLSAVETLSTVPNLGIMIFVLLSSVIAKYLGNKRTVMIGLWIALIAGITPVFSDNFTLVLISRFFLGAGIGLFNPLAYSFIIYYYKGQEQATMLGYQTSVANFGSAILTFIAGALIKFGWHEAYWVYVSALICIFLFGIFVPNPKIKASSTKITTNHEVLGYTAYIFLIYGFFYIVIVKLASVLTAGHYGNGSSASYLISLMTIVGVAASILYGRVFKVVKRFVLPIAVTGLGLFVGLIGISKNMWLTAFACCMLGVFFVMVNPYLFGQANAHSPKGANNATSSLLIMGMNLGCFISPIMVDSIAGIFHMTSAGESLIVAAVILVAMGIINGVLDIFHRPTPSSSTTTSTTTTSSQTSTAASQASSATSQASQATSNDSQASASSN